MRKELCGWYTAVLRGGAAMLCLALYRTGMIFKPTRVSCAAHGSQCVHLLLMWIVGRFAKGLGQLAYRVLLGLHHALSHTRSVPRAVHLYVACMAYLACWHCASQEHAARFYAGTGI